MRALRDIAAADFAAAQSPGGKAWMRRGRGAAELVAADTLRRALLLERLDASRSLARIPLAEATATAGALVRTLSVPAPASLPALPAAAAQLTVTFRERQRALGDPVPDQWVRLATGLAAGLARDCARCLVHTDLHYGNILASGPPGPALSRDRPRGGSRGAQRSVAELLWTRADELASPRAISGLVDTIVENGRLDRTAAFAWGFVRAIDYWLWGLENGLTADPLRCQRVAGALVPVAGSR